MRGGINPELLTCLWMREWMWVYVSSGSYSHEDSHRYTNNSTTDRNRDLHRNAIGVEK